VDGGDHFGDGRHADGIAAEAAEHAVLGAGFVIRAEDRGVDAAVEDEAVAHGDFERAAL
jgi:hypothetical protein